MKRVFIAGSRKFWDDVEAVARRCAARGITAETAGKLPSGKDTQASEKAALMRAFRRIDGADAVYVVAKEGHVGKTVALEIGYAFAKHKPVFSSEKIADFSANALVKKAVPISRIVSFLSR